MKRVVDIRLRNDSQLAGFAKAADLPYFLRELNGAEYEHNLQLAPTNELLDAFRSTRDSAAFEPRFLALMAERNIPATLDRISFEATTTALLCIEPPPATAATASSPS